MRHMECCPVMKRQGGYTLPELIIGALVAGALALIFFGAYKYFVVDAKVKAEISNQQLISGAIRDDWKASNDYAGLSAAGMIIRKRVPEKMITNATLQNRWGGSVSVDPGSINGGTNNAFSITYNNVPVDACLNFVAGAVDGYAQVTIDGTAVKTPTSSYNQGTAANACGSAPESVTVVLTGN